MIRKRALNYLLFSSILIVQFLIQDASAQLIITDDPIIKQILEKYPPPEINPEDIDALGEAEEIARKTPPFSLGLCIENAARLGTNLVSACINDNSKLKGWTIRTIEVQSCHSATLLTSRDKKRHYYLDSYLNPRGLMGGAVELIQIDSDKWVPKPNQFSLQMYAVAMACGFVSEAIADLEYWTTGKLEWPEEFFFKQVKGAPGIEVECPSTSQFSKSLAIVPNIITNGCTDPEEATSLPVQAVGSRDPNEKMGAPGFGENRYISAEEPLRYAVFFENIETATAPAQEVFITDTLEVAKLDLATFSFGPIYFGKDKHVFPPSGLNEFSTDVDLRPNKNLILRINASLDKTMGVLKWTFRSLDPKTGELTTDPLAGFLPPNVNPPEGEGNVLFNVMPKQRLNTSTVIRNSASIVFDSNPVIKTKTWLNTIDNTKPISQVMPLPEVQVADSFEVKWSGTDDGSGIIDYTVYVSVDSGSYVPWLTNSIATSAMFKCELGRTYSFYSIARDGTKNAELQPKDADAKTKIVDSVELPTEFLLHQNYPNPFNSGTVIKYEMPNSAHVRLKVFDILGRLVAKLVDENKMPGRYTVLWQPEGIANGVYIYRIEAGDFKAEKKLVFLK